MSEAMEALIHAVGVWNGDENGHGAKVALIQGQYDPDLEPYRGRLTVTQWHKLSASSFEEQGIHVTPIESLAGCEYGEVWVLPDRQRDCQMGDVADAWEKVEEGGRLVVAVRNDWGAKRLEEQWRSVAGSPVTTLSKHHCRVFMTRKGTPTADSKVLERWKAKAALQRVPPKGHWSRPGLFSWDREDLGTSILAAELPETLSGAGADFGVGWGYLSMEVLQRCADVESLDGFDVDARALEPARRNLGNVLVRVRPRLYWRDVTAGVGLAKYDFIVMNPPFHEGRDADPRLGLKFIGAAAKALKRDGELWLVANRHLPYEPLLTELFDEVTLRRDRMGFKVLRARGVKASVHAQFPRKRGRR